MMSFTFLYLFVFFPSPFNFSRTASKVGGLGKPLLLNFDGALAQRRPAVLEEKTRARLKGLAGDVRPAALPARTPDESPAGASASRPGALGAR